MGEAEKRNDEARPTLHSGLKQTDGKAQMKQSFSSHKGTCNDANISSGSDEICIVLCTGIASSCICQKLW